MEELRDRLDQVCRKWSIQRFSPAEMIELLEDGEEVEWIIGQVLPGGEEEAVRELSELLGQISEQAAPGEEEAGEESETGPSLEGELDWEALKEVPLPPGVDLSQLEQLLSSPRGEMLADFSAFCQEKGVEAEGDQEEMEGLLRELHEEWLQTPRESLEGKKPAELLQGGRLFPQKVETFRRETPKIGRNDPCPCGSGKKYKRCCGKAV